MAAGPARGPVPPSLDGVFYKTGMNILLAVVTCGIWMFVWTFRTGEDLKQHNGDGLGGLLHIVILFFLSPVTMFLLPNEVQKMYERDGRQSPVTTLLGLWFLLPIVGNIIWYVKMQNALNDYWVSKGSRPAAA
jgi:hypothetical protein